eukprot:CAMPEP_0198226036 /NCGR_PEP_ID=MMETSP1445-20131203/103573_1 /TAXON_ID=36898 /ORGANISM="Pyramimonas sp., Strain CCMP2087" /LENGTH=238 /DNA_ID=CAMNT_0043905749 /DNA_START=83 /DNA_END=795 /DNA_ORIENTATION=+
MSLSREEIVALLTRDADALKRKADVEGVTAYARRPIHRARPNTVFLSNTLKSVKIVNRLETEAQRRRNFRANPADSHGASCSRGASYSHGASSSQDQHARSSKSAIASKDLRGKMHHRVSASSDSTNSQNTSRSSTSSAGGGSTTSGISGGISSDKEFEGSLKMTAEDRLEEQDLASFLSGKRKRGRGTVGSRADMPGPYLPRGAMGASEAAERCEGQTKARRVLGPAAFPPSAETRL